MYNKETDMYEGYIYKISNNVNDKVYIGQTIETIEKRFKDHISASKCENKKGVILYNAMHKYGVENFSHEILKENLTKNEADYWERYYIEEFDTIKNGYNLKTGGTHCIYSEASKQKMSKNHADVSGEKNPMYGKKHSLESRIKMSQNRHDKKGSESCFAKKVICVETQEIFGCIKDAAEWCGLSSHSSISRYLNGGSKSAGTHPETHEKLHWEYYIEK